MNGDGASFCPEKVHGYLSQILQQVWKDTLVFEQDLKESKNFVARRGDQSELNLGDNFASALKSCRAVVNAERAKQSKLERDA